LVQQRKRHAERPVTKAGDLLVGPRLLRSPITSRSNCAKESRLLSVSGRFCGPERRWHVRDGNASVQSTEGMPKTSNTELTSQTKTAKLKAA
jgi:hypothetical protein